MNSKRFDFALASLTGANWERFEKLASAYLAGEFDQLRTTANPEGDQGRDSTLFSPEGENTVMLQYSIATDWENKIRRTAARLHTTFPDAQILIYVTNQIIGAKADSLKASLRKKYRLSVDVRDRHWFLERLAYSTERQQIAEEFTVEIADPILSSKGLIKSKAPALTKFEAKAALLQLGLQWEDDSREKGLTKMAYEALVKSALRETSSEHRMSRAQICKQLCGLLPTHPAEQVESLVNSALERMSKKSVRYWKQQDEYCLSHDEVIRLRNYLAADATKEQALALEIFEACRVAGETLDAPAGSDFQGLIPRVRRIIDCFLLQEGELFASHATAGTVAQLGISNLATVVAEDFAKEPNTKDYGGIAADISRLAAVSVITSVSATIRSYLRELSDAYTLFAFLKETPDVQQVISKMFADAEVWLDTTVILPAIAETLLAEGERPVTALLAAATTAGLDLKVTAGVVEEVERHMNRSLACSAQTSIGGWKGPLPFLFAIYVLSGKSQGSFHSWIEEFRGNERPREDVAEYLRTEFNITEDSLAEAAASAPQELRFIAERFWQEAQSQRRDILTTSTDRLVAHDVENFVGVIAKRKRSNDSELGYRSWWLTFDKTARALAAALPAELGAEAPRSPVMSPDFLANYIALGPNRGRISKGVEKNLPVAVADLVAEFIPVDFLEVAERIRTESVGSSDRLVRRKLRDALDRARWRTGPVAQGGLGAIVTDLQTKVRRTSGN